MVEMTETANILRNATPESLVIIDEIGRGTSTFDGLALATSIATFLVNNCASNSLFATHYFELTNLASQNLRIHNVHVSARKYGEKVIFLHTIKDGPASQSYGIEVAGLAGIPAAVINGAKKHLSKLELVRVDANGQKDLFMKPETPPQPLEKNSDRILKIISSLQLDDLSPREAQSILYEIIELFNSS